MTPSSRTKPFPRQPRRVIIFQFKCNKAGANNVDALRQLLCTHVLLLLLLLLLLLVWKLL
jgi:hypothetical protein